MADRDAYIALVTSLPRPERLFFAKQPPLSRLRLDRRLSDLTPEDRETLRRIEHLLSWSNYGMEADASVSAARVAAALDGLESATLRAIIEERVDLRTVVAALRIRARGDGPPPGQWSASRLTRHLAENWRDPVFRLDRRLPWLPQAAKLLEARDPLGLERHMLDVTFRQLQRHGARHFFDFEAVVIYVLKWNIFERWSRSDARAAARRFERLADEALASFDEDDLRGAA